MRLASFVIASMLFGIAYEWWDDTLMSTGFQQIGNWGIAGMIVDRLMLMRENL